jgi:regulator of replication initiation timing
MIFQQAKVMSSAAIPPGISEMSWGLIVAFIFGTVLFVVKYGKQCCDNVKWIIEVCKMNTAKGIKKQQEETTKKVDSSDEGLSKEEIAEIKEEISTLSQQIKTILTEIKQIRKTAIQKALEDDVRLALTEYAMKFELKRPEYDKAMRILQVVLAKMPEEGVAYHQKVNHWISKAQEKFNDYSPDNFIQKVEAVKNKRRPNQDKQNTN